uniref:Uncharacterized protein n=1 Tax=Arundo donax TaxID=35708 RepID=A0A0A9CGM3_ARUDO
MFLFIQQHYIGYLKKLKKKCIDALMCPLSIIYKHVYYRLL